MAVGAVAGPPLEQPWLRRGDGPLIEVQSRGRWVIGSAEEVPTNEDDTLAAVSCPTAHLCVAVGPSSLGQQVPSGSVHVYSVRFTY